MDLDWIRRLWLELLYNAIDMLIAICFKNFSSLKTWKSAIKKGVTLAGRELF